jgi:hypothetical protein
MDHCPFVDLLSTHGAAHDESKLFDAEVLGDQFVLGCHIVANAQIGELAHRLWRRIVLRRGRNPAAQLIYHDDEVF